MLNNLCYKEILFGRSFLEVMSMELKNEIENVGHNLILVFQMSIRKYFYLFRVKKEVLLANAVLERNKWNEILRF